MADAWVGPAWRRWSGGVLAGAVLVAAASGVVALLEASMQQLVGRPLVYLLAVLLVATRWGLGPGIVTAVASVVTFTYLFVPPRVSFAVQDLTLGVSLVIFLVVGLIVAWQAAHLRRKETESARLSREQAGLRRVATLVAGAARPREVFAAVDDEVARLLEPDLTTLVRFEPDGSATFLAGGGWRGRAMRLGHTLPVPRSLEPLRDRSVVRIDDLHERPDMSEALEKQGVVAVVACPVVVEGRVWGAFGVGSRGDPFPATTERRLVDFTELIGTAIANAESRTEITRLLDEQGALRRVATVVARGVPPERVFAMVTDEIGRLLDANVAVMFRLEPDGGTTVVANTGQVDEMPVGSRWEFDPHMASAEVLRTGRPARRDEYSGVEGPFAGIIERLRPRSSVAIPVLVAGRIWGVLAVAATRERFPADTEQRITGFADLVGTAIANAEGRTQVARLLEVQAALHRVATLVAREATPDEVVPAVTEEIRRTLDADATLVVRLDADGQGTIVAQHGPHPPELRVGRRWTPDTGLAMAEALQTGKPAVREGYSAQPLGEDAAELIDAMGVNHAIALPIVVDGKVWGAVGVARTREEPFPPDVAQRVPGFAELLATSLRNTENRTQTRRLLEEQAALRRVAMLVAHGASEQEVFTAAADEVATVLEADVVMLYRIDDEDAATATLMGLSGWPDGPVGRTIPTNEDAVAAFRRGEPLRLDDIAVMPEATGALEGSGIGACVVVPIILGDRLWGTVLAGSRSAPLPAGSEQRLAGFAELFGTAIANTESRAEIVRLLDEQSALRRVATVVARGASEREVFAAAAEEVATLLGADMAALYRFDGEPIETVTAMSLSGWGDGPVGQTFKVNAETIEAFRRGGPVRVDDVRRMPDADAALRGSGVRAVIAHAVVVEGRPWGAFMIGSRSGPLPAEPERRLASFAELIGTAIANTQSRAEIVRLLDEQSALRRVATVVARDAPAEEVFRASVDEVVGLLGVDVALLFRFDGEAAETATLLGVSGWEGGRAGMVARSDLRLLEVLQAGETVRLDDIAESPQAVAAMGASGIRALVATAIIIEGRAWGAFAAGARGGPLPPGTEQRLASFAELVATAIANTQSKAEITSLLEHQAALRRVATLVAREAPPDEVMPAVADEIGRVFGADAMHMLRLEPDGGATIVAQKGDHPPEMGVGNRYALDPGLAMTEALRTGRPARRDSYDGLGPEYAELIGRMRLRAGIAIPILVHGHVWGTLGIAASRGPFPPDTERRLASFTELIALAIGNAESRAQVRRLLAEQGALERVATLVAAGPTPAAVSRVVAEEIRVLLGASDACVCRFEPDGASVLLAGVGEHIGLWPAGIRWPLDDVDSSSEVWRTGRPARLDGDRWMRARGRVTERLRQIGVRSGVACPVTVDGRLWGAVMSWSQKTSLPADSEQRMARFTDLVAMAIGNAEHQAELAASRARIVAASDEARRRIERDLHDGAQQRIVSLGLELRLVQAGVPDELPEVRDGLGRIVEELGQLLDELRETARGIHPAMLAEGGLQPALRTLARRAPVPVELDLRTEARFPEPVEVATYYVVSEALTNAAKHAAASHVAVSLAERDGVLRLSVSDDGAGGADPQRGSGLIGLRDRVEALGGTIEVESPKGTGTTVVVRLPIADDGREPLTASPDR